MGTALTVIGIVRVGSSKAAARPDSVNPSAGELHQIGGTNVLKVAGN
ncbi:MAG: hypothetical protein ACR2ME_01995 [Acidimicrobiia bacterium]